MSSARRLRCGRQFSATCIATLGDSDLDRRDAAMLSTLYMLALRRSRVHPRGGIGGRITADGANRAIKAASTRYYLATGADKATAARLAARYSGHSGRVGFVVASKEAGAGDTDVASTTKHRSLEMIRRYGAVADQRRRAAHRLPGVGL